MSSGLVARCGVRVLERVFRGLAHCPCSRSTGRGIEVLVPDSPVEMLPAGDGGAEKKRGGLSSPPLH
jgi:hypothetical protein